MKLQTEVATHTVRFKDKEKKPVAVTGEKAMAIMTKMANKEFIAIQLMDGDVMGEQYYNITSVEPIKKLKNKKRVEDDWKELTQEQLLKRREKSAKVREQVAEISQKMAM